MHSRSMTFADIEGLTEDQIIVLADQIRGEKNRQAVKVDPHSLNKMTRIKIDASTDFSS